MKYKIGLLYVKDGQTDENDMFSNGGDDTPSADFEDFLKFIGERVTLMGMFFLLFVERWGFMCD